MNTSLTFPNKRAHGPWIAHLNPCQEERTFTTKYKSHSPALKSILGITQIITKAYQSNYTYLHNFNVWPFYPTHKAKGVHNVKHINCIMWYNTTQPSSEKKCVYLLSPYRSQGCVKRQNICMHGVICFILINLIMQHDYFQKKKQIYLLSPPQGPRVSLRVKYLLTCFCKLHSLYCICNMTIFWKTRFYISLCDPCDRPNFGHRGII